MAGARPAAPCSASSSPAIPRCPPARRRWAHQRLQCVLQHACYLSWRCAEWGRPGEPFTESPKCFRASSRMASREVPHDMARVMFPSLGVTDGSLAPLWAPYRLESGLADTRSFTKGRRGDRGATLPSRPRATRHMRWAFSDERWRDCCGHHKLAEGIQFHNHFSSPGTFLGYWVAISCALAG